MYVYAMSVMSLLIPISRIGIPTLINREATCSKTQNLWGYFYALFVCASKTIILLSTCIILVAFVVLWLLFEQHSPHTTYLYVWLLLLLPFSGFMRILSATLHGLHHIILNKIVSRLVPAVIFPTVIGTLFLLLPETHFPEYVTFIKWVVGIISLIIVLLVFRHKIDEKFHPTKAVCTYQELWHKTSPFMLIGGAGMLYSQIDILMLGYFRSSSEVGIYNVATKIAFFVLLALQIINSFVGPQMVKMYAQKNIRQLQKLVTISTRFAFSFALLVCLVLWIVGQELIDFIFGAEFALAYIPLSILIVGNLFGAMMGAVRLLAQSSYNEKYVMRIMWLSILLNTILNVFFIPLWGMVGASISTTICMIINNLFMNYISRTKTGINSSIFYGLRGLVG